MIFISAIAHVLAKGAHEQFHLPLELVALIPGAVLLTLSFFAFKASVLRILAFWIVGLVLYMMIHVILSEVFGVTFLFSVWTPI